MRHLFVLSFFIVSLGLGQLQAQVGLNPAEAAPGRLLLDIQRAQVTGTVMYIAAHPDDENTAMLAYLASERKVRTVYLSLTRGDGGQNLIGPEQGELLGLIRTHELLQARRIDGAEQRFTRAVDLGFCKSPDEAYQQWPHDSVLADVVWTIRTVQPDVIICRFPTDGGGGHGHHTASALLAEEAYAAAADPKRFAEQLAYVKPWQVRRVYWNAWTSGSRPGQPSATPAPADWLSVDVGAYNPQLGMSYTEVAGLSRSQHKSQGFGAPQRRGSRLDYLQHKLGPRAERDLLEGVEQDWARLPGGAAVQAALARAEAAFTPTEPSRAVPALAEALVALRALEARSDAAIVRARRYLVEQTLLRCAGFYAELTAAEFTSLRGGRIAASLSALHRSALPLAVHINSERIELVGNTLLTRDLSLPAPALSGPYWLDPPPRGGLFQSPLPRRGTPDAPLSPTQAIEVEVAGQRIGLTLPVQHRWVDPTQGDRYRAVEVGPGVSVSFDEKAFVFADGPRAVGLRVTALSGATQGRLRLELPEGWRAEPAELSYSLGARDADTLVRFTVTPGERGGAVSALVDGAPALSRTRVQYDHIPYQVLYRPASARLTRVTVQCAARRVGYVMGAGDEVPAALRQLGLSVEPLTGEQLLATDPAAMLRLDAIVVGVRAYNVDALAKNWVARLVRYAELGGTVVVQYQTTASLLTPTLGPYPFVLTRERIADETAPLRFALPEHPALTTPNRLTPADFDGWVQERGLYFAGGVDARYAQPLEGHDPGEPSARGMLLVASVGKGAFVYTGLAFFRQLPAGVPGAYRLFANLLSLTGSDRPNGSTNRP